MNNAMTYLDMTFAGRQIKSAQMAVDTSLNERVLDVDTMNATVESETALTPFQQNTPVRFLRGGSQYALWYLAQITRVAPKLWALSMTSSLGRLTQMPHKGGIYNGVAASAIIDDICGVVPHFVGAAFQNVLLYGWLPYVAPSGENGAQTGSAKDNLLKVLFALNATVRDDADGTLRIENLSTAVSARLSPDRIYRDNASVVTEPTVTAVTVLEHQYITGSETTTLFEGTTVDGQVIVFREPMSNLTATGFTVTESNANYAVVSAGSGTLTGTPYIHTTREITKPVTAAAIPNAVRIEDATLVGVTNSSDVVNRLVDYYSHRTYINVDATIDLEDAGDVVEIYDPFDKVLRQACIEKISPLVVSQTMKGRISALVGFTPWQVVPFEDVRELLTGSGTWTVPTGVTQVAAVLIGSGGGGNGGENGTSGDGSSGSWRFTLGTISAPAGSGGSGGAGGAAGIAGRILRVEFTVTAGSSFGYSCAPGGTGGSAGGGTGGTSGDTTFGSSSSASGAISDAGYADPITGTTYALPAASGGDGAGGGAGGPVNSSAASNGYSGGSAGGYSGGAGGTGAYQIYGLREVTARESSAGGGGGGASASRNGTNGSDATIESGVDDKRGADGGRGADGASGSPGATYGCAGAGGNGGGGGGGAGGWYYWQRDNYGTITVTYRAYGGSGGAGGAGGAGAPGCIILYYRRPKLVQSVSKIEIVSPPTKTSYKHGEQFSSAGMNVQATYSNGATKMVTNFTCLPSRALKFTDEKITVVYAENGITRSAEQAISVGSPVVITDVRQLPYTYNLKGCGKHNNQYLMVGNDASWNLYGTIAPVSGQVNNYKMNASGTYPAAGMLVTDTRIDIPLTDKYGGTLYKNRYKSALTVADFLAKQQGFQVTSAANVRMNCITEGGNGYIYTGGKSANGESCVTYVSKSAGVDTNLAVPSLGSNGEIIDIASCKDSAGASHLAALTENGKILYKDLNTSGGLSGSIIGQSSNAVKVGMLPDDTNMYRCAYVFKESNNFYLASTKPGELARTSYPAVTSGNSTILGVGAINNYAIVVFADAAGNAKIYINEDWENGKTYSLNALTPLAMCKIPNGIGVICKTSTTNTLVIKEITLAE